MTGESPRGAGTIVLFDWNGTVVLDADRARASLNSVLAQHGLKTLNGERFAQEFHLPMASMFVRLGVPEPGRAEADWNLGMIARTTRARSGVEALRRLGADGSVRLGVVSAAASASVETDLAELALEGIWDTVDAPSIDKVATLRHRRDAILRAFYVGDTTYDMTCAIDAGYVPIAVAGGYSPVDALKAAGAVHVIETFDELAGLLA